MTERDSTVETAEPHRATLLLSCEHDLLDDRLARILVEVTAEAGRYGWTGGLEMIRDLAAEAQGTLRGA